MRNKLSATFEEIENYIKNMNSVLLSPDGRLVIKFERDKNFVFKYLYKIDIKMVRDILLEIRGSDFYEKGRSLIYSNEELYVWHPKRILTASNGEKREVELYIKTFLDVKNKIIVVISFHKFHDFS